MKVAIEIDTLAKWLAWLNENYQHELPPGGETLEALAAEVACTIEQAGVDATQAMLANDEYKTQVAQGHD